MIKLAKANPSSNFIFQHKDGPSLADGYSQRKDLNISCDIRYNREVLYTETNCPTAEFLSDLSTTDLLDSKWQDRDYKVPKEEEEKYIRILRKVRKDFQKWDRSPYRCFNCQCNSGHMQYSMFFKYFETLNKLYQQGQANYFISCVIRVIQIQLHFFYSRLDAPLEFSVASIEKGSHE